MAESHQEDQEPCIDYQEKSKVEPMGEETKHARGQKPRKIGKFILKPVM